MCVPFICKHCGRAKDRHNATAHSRNSDFSPLLGYEKSFNLCPGFEQKTNQRQPGSGENYVGLEKRLKPPPTAAPFDERQRPRAGARERPNAFVGDDRRRK